MEPAVKSRVGFGVFEADLAARELWKDGRKIRLQDQPFRLLAALLERPREVVTKEELTERVWGEAPPSEPDHSLSIAVGKIRTALGDSAENPRFIETLPSGAYRFIAPVESVPGPDPGPPTPVPRPRFLFPFLGAGLAVAAAIVLMIRGCTPSVCPPVVTRFAIPCEKDCSSPAISPDGRHVAFVSGDGDGTLWVHDFENDEDQSRELAGTEGANDPFWSPDSQWIGFAAADELKKVSIDDGPEVVLCRLLDRSFWGGTWSPDGRSIVFAVHNPGSLPRLYEVDARGGEPELLFEPSDEERKMGFGHPHFLPLPNGPRMLLYAVGYPSRSKIVLRNLDTGEQEVLGVGAMPVYSLSGHILYQTSTAARGLWALPVSLKTRKPTGTAFTVESDGLDVSVANGWLVYLDRTGGGKMQLVWRDRSGNELGAIGQPQEQILYPALSPDEQRVAVRGVENASGDVWIHEIGRPSKTRLSIEHGYVTVPIWSPSGQVTFSVSVNGIFTIHQKPARADGNAKVLLASPFHDLPSDWSMDGRYLLIYRNDPQTLRDIWYLRRKDDGSGYEERLFLKTPFWEHAASFSPDGRFVVYVSDEAGPYDVYVRPFPEGSDRWKVSVDNGGAQPRWSQDGTEIFYVEGDTLIAATVSTEPNFSVKERRRLFQSVLLRGNFVPNYDVSRDGSRFVVVEPVGERLRTAIKIVQNWLAEFQERVEY